MTLQKPPYRLIYLPAALMALLVLVLTAPHRSYGQQPVNNTVRDSMAEKKSPRPGLAVQAKAYGDSVVIRWAPTDGVAWMLSKHKGYSVYRVSGTGDHADTLLLTPRPLKPMTLTELNRYASSGNKYIALAAQALYGKNFTPANHKPESFTEEIQQQVDAYNLRFFVAMQSADLSIEAAKALALRYVDKSAQKNKVYSYIVRSDTSAEGIVVRPGLITVPNVVAATPMTPQGLEGLSGDHKIELHWYRRQVGGYSYYHIERSDDGGKTYHRLTTEPYFSSYNPRQAPVTDSSSKSAQINAVLEQYQIYIDSVAENYKDYYYRVAGIDAFGDQSGFSAAVAVHGVDKVPPAAVTIDSISQVPDSHMLIRWTDPRPAGDLAGYFVAKGDNIKGPFVPVHKELLPRGTTYFLDTTAATTGKTIYVVASIDTAGNYNYSIPRIGILTDSIPPARPGGLVGLMDSLGLIGLQWTPNTEADIKGYRIYSSYNPLEGFIQVTQTPLPVNTFIDSISPASLNRSIYYKIDAMDIYGNVSGFSSVVKIDKPVVVAPNSPVPLAIYVEGPAIVINWQGSSSEGVKSYEVYRKEPENESWNLLKELAASYGSQKIVFKDSSAAPNRRYSYSIVAVDLTGKKSAMPTPVELANSKQEVLKEVALLKADYDARQNKVMVSWEYTQGRKAVSSGYFMLYRSEGEAAAELLTTLKADLRGYVDSGVRPGKKYRYSIEVRMSGSPLKSRPVQSGTVTIPVH